MATYYGGFVQATNQRGQIATTAVMFYLQRPDKNFANNHAKGMAFDQYPPNKGWGSHAWDVLEQR